MSFDDMTISEFKRLADMLSTSSSQHDSSPYSPGTAWIFRCITHYTVGTVVDVVGTSIVLEPGACWVADTGRYHEFLRDGWSAASEVEPYPDGTTTVVERGAVVDAHEWVHGHGRKVIG